MTKDEMVKGLRYKAENIKAHIEPEFFAEIADYLESQKTEQCEDAISREAALLALTGVNLLSKKPEELISLFDKRIKTLPSVAPKQKTGTKMK